MSIKVMTLVWDNFPRGGSDKLTMLAMADWCNDQGSSLHPSISTVAKKINLSDKQARLIIHRLISEGWLYVVGNEFGGNPGMSRQYRMNVQKLSTPPMEVTPPAKVTTPMEVRDPSRGGAFTPPAHGSLTTIEPPIEPPIVIPTSQAKPTKRKHSLPEDFEPKQSHYDLAAKLSVDLMAELHQFCDYHGANGSTMADWNLALNTWLRNANKWGTKKNQYLTPQQQRDENNRRSTEEFLNESSTLFSNGNLIDGEFSNA